MEGIVKTKTQLFNISTANALNGDFCSYIRVQIPSQTFHLDNIQSAYLSINHVECPNSFYIVNYTNNQLVVDGVTYIIPRGNYNANTMITALQDILLAGFTMTFSNTTTKFTILQIGGSSFTINASDPNCTINAVLGLGNVDIEINPSVPFTLPNCCNFIPLQRINFRTNYFKIANYDLTNGSSDIILPLQNNAGQGAMINYINQTQNRFLIEDRNVTVFEIRITDDLGRLINFNGIPTTITLQIDVDYLDAPRNTSFGAITGLAKPAITPVVPQTGLLSSLLQQGNSAPQGSLAKMLKSA
jgi:hypothetical protein